MRIPVTARLFAWECLDDQPSLTTIRDLLALFSDGQLLDALRAWRGRGRNDHPVHVLWGVVLLTVILRHPSTEATLAELRRNAGLRRLIGIEDESEVPDGYNVSRFVKVLGHPAHVALMREMFDTMIRRLGAAVPDLGARTAGDATGLSARPEGTPEPDLPAPSGGRKEYVDEAGKVVKVVEWVGYKLHLIVDVQHEVALAYAVTAANVGDNAVVPALVAEAQGNVPAGRMKSLAYDKAADDEKVHVTLAQASIAPVVEIRSLWKGESERVLPGRTDVVYDEAGTVSCYDMRSDPPVRRKMAYIGREGSRATLKYRCPARHGHWSCPSEARCNEGKRYGKTVRVPQALDLRRFPPIPRATKQFERLYRGRTAVERVNARLKVFWGADDGNLVGAARFHALVGVVMLVHAGCATALAMAPRREGTLGRMRLGPIAEALRAKPE